MSRQRGTTFDDCDAYEDQRARDEKREADLVDQAFRDILNHDFDSFAVNEVLNRRAGSLIDYHAAKQQMEIVERVARACGNP